MAKQLSKSGISTNDAILAWHVTQSVDAFTGTEAYDVTVSGSLTITGSTSGTFTGSFTGSFDGLIPSASYAATATSASYAATATSASYALTASFLEGSVTSASYAATATSASYALTASFLEGSVTSASYAATASYILASNIDQPFTNITASGNISASGNIYGNLYQIKNQTIATYAGNVLRLADGAWDYVDINNTTVTIGGGTGALQLQNITASSNISSSGTASAAYFVGNGSELTNLQRPITSSSTNLSASMDNAGYYFRVGGNVTCSIGTNAVVPIKTGTEYEFFQTSSAGNFYITGSGITLNSKGGNIQLAGQFSAATLKKVGTNEWDLIGDLG
jgi:hypothetical protein